MVVHLNFHGDSKKLIGKSDTYDIVIIVFVIYIFITTKLVLQYLH